MKKKMLNRSNLGSIAPLAVVFTLVSMTFTAAYLKNSFSQAAMENYRFSEWKALYAAEAGLNEVGVVVLPFITHDTLILRDGVEYGEDEYGEPIGKYKDIACSTKLVEGTTDNEYIAQATGVAEYTTPTGNEVTIEREVYTTMIPEGFEDFMYFTNEEEPIGPGNTGTVTFGGSDSLEGSVHTNGTMVMSQYGCPDFTGEVSITHKAIEDGGGVQYGPCQDVFEEEDDDGETISILDTVKTIDWPPSNSAEVTRQHATRVIEADDKLFRGNKKDTLIMTEINFVQGGYYVAQWWYNIPPVGNPPTEYDYFYDSLATGLTDRDDGTLHLGANNQFDFVDSTYTTVNNPPVLLISSVDATGDVIPLEEIQDLINNGDLIRVENADGTKWIQFIATGTVIPFDPMHGIFYEPTSFSSSVGIPFFDNEPVTFINTSASTGLNADVEWNSFYYYHDHVDGDGSYCEPGRIQHFDFEYWFAGGPSCDIFNCPDLIYNSDYVHMDRTFFPKGNSPHVLYVKGGQVLVRGTVDGQYTIVTDDYTEYRRHDDMSIIDRVWGNIWLIDDVVYEDSYSSGETIHPDDGGTDNVLGLIAGGNVIIANTRPNGARNRLYGDDIKINAAIMAMYGGCISHYWQNTLQDYHDAVEVTWNGITTVIADGRGGHRNYYRAETSTPPNYGGVYTGSSDYRGYVNLWGSIVQDRRGYMLRNQAGPYNVPAPGVGYDKNYNYDWNLRIKRPPFFPNRQNDDGSITLNMASYGERRKQN